ncbi:hypothetical protein [Polaromonas hydrogenivorans]|uniref:DUF3168 domain-containing protein n=1 Tax=Polaromonas hydrogenivorans TaxID=335476 RepID=A0AAU7LYG3_9BURK
MLALEPLLKTRLQALSALIGWAVRCGTELSDRRIVPAADVRCTGAQVPDNKAGAVMVAPEWTVTLVVRRSDEAAGQLDAAFAAVLTSLHNWAPGQQGGRGWEAVRLVRIVEPQFLDEGLAGSELVFNTAARYISANN